MGKFLLERFNGDPIHITGDERTRKQIIVSANSDLALRAIDVDDIERRTSGYAESLALADGEIVDAFMMPQHLAIGGDKFAGSIRQALTLFSEIGVNEPLVIAAGNKADFLRIGLFRQR